MRTRHVLGIILPRLICDNRTRLTQYRKSHGLPTRLVPERSVLSSRSASEWFRHYKGKKLNNTVKWSRISQISYYMNMVFGVFAQGPTRYMSTVRSELHCP
jgi:hypothetical protein